jgi:hypothetical protein
MLGYSKSEMLSLTLQQIVPNEFAQKNLVSINKLEQGKPILVERQFTKKMAANFMQNLIFN